MIRRSSTFIRRPRLFQFAQIFIKQRTNVTTFLNQYILERSTNEIWESTGREDHHPLLPPFHFFFSFNSFSKQRSFVYKRSFNWEICVTQASKVTVSDFILWFRHSKGWCANIAQQLWIMPGISTLAIIGTFLELFRKNWWYLSLRREIIITLLCVLFFVSVLYISKTWWWFIGKVVQSVA